MTTSPLALIAELTHRCPLSCGYCSNPLELERAASELPTEVWTRIFAEAADLGVLHAHFTGGEPMSRRDIPALIGAASCAGLYTNLITSGVTLDDRALGALIDAGVDHVQLSFQDSKPATADAIGGLEDAGGKAETVAQLDQLVHAGDPGADDQGVKRGLRRVCVGHGGGSRGLGRLV